MATGVLTSVETAEVLRSGQILSILERRPKGSADKLGVKVKHDLKIFGLSHWQDEMEKTVSEGKGQESMFGAC